jgi:hypothetical protein
MIRLSMATVVGVAAVAPEKASRGAGNYALMRSTSLRFASFATSG